MHFAAWLIAASRCLVLRSFVLPASCSDALWFHGPLQLAAASGLANHSFAQIVLISLLRAAWCLQRGRGNLCSLRVAAWLITALRSLVLRSFVLLVSCSHALWFHGSLQLVARLIAVPRSRVHRCFTQPGLSGDPVWMLCFAQPASTTVRIESLLIATGGLARHGIAQPRTSQLRAPWCIQRRSLGPLFIAVYGLAHHSFANHVRAARHVQLCSLIAWFVAPCGLAHHSFARPGTSLFRAGWSHCQLLLAAWCMQRCSRFPSFVARRDLALLRFSLPGPSLFAPLTPPIYSRLLPRVWGSVSSWPGRRSDASFRTVHGFTVLTCVSCR